MAKIAILYELLGRSRGGIEAWIYHAAEELLKQNHKVTLYNTQEMIPGDAAPDGTRIVTLHLPKRIPAFNFMLQVFSLRSQLKNELAQYDAVWARSFTMAFSANMAKKIKNVIYINAAPFSYYGQVSFSERMKNFPGLVGALKVIASEIYLKIAWYLEKNAILNCLNVFLSNARKNETLSFFKVKDNQTRYFVIPPGVNSRKFFPYHQYWDGISPLKLIAVCRLKPDKNIQCLLKAMALLINERIFVNLTVVGEGDYENELRVLAKELRIDDLVYFSGRQENVEDWYRKCHVFVLPSLYEGFGSVYVEAMASGLPCIAVSNKSGQYSVASDEIIDHGVNGFLMKENDPRELAEYLRLFYQDQKKLKYFSKNARIKAETQYKWNKTIEMLLQLSFVNKKSI